MNPDVNTCPKCGALISPNLPRCRQCKQYLHGTQVEGFLLEHLLPGRLAAAPGTGTFFLLIIGYYILMVMFAGFQSAPGFSPFSTQQLGSTWSLGIFEGQYWRFGTSMLAHGGLIHLAFNLYALTIVGPLVEQAFDRKKMMLIFLVSGMLSMVASHVFYSEIMGQVVRGSVGASGAVSGLIGACLLGARRLGPPGREVAQVMWRWTIYMGIWGIAVSGIDNAAHVGGWLVGAGLGAIIPLGLAKTVAAQRGLSVAVLGLLGVVLLCIGLMLANLRGFPASLEKDAYPRSLFFFTYAEGTEWQYSSQFDAGLDCQNALQDVARTGKVTDENLYACELATRAIFSPASYSGLAMLYERRGNLERAKVLQSVAKRLQRR